MKDLHINLFKLLTDSNLCAKFNAAVQLEGIFFDREYTLNGLMVDVSDNNDNGIWDADCQADAERALLIVTGHQFCSGMGQVVNAHIDVHGNVIWTDHPTMTVEQLKLNSIYVEPVTAEAAAFLIKEFWDCLYAD